MGRLETAAWSLVPVGGLVVLSGYCWLLLGAGFQPITGPLVCLVVGLLLNFAGMILFVHAPWLRKGKR